jgi:hypothetical protein
MFPSSDRRFRSDRFVAAPFIVLHFQIYIVGKLFASNWGPLAMLRVVPEVAETRF